MSIAMAANRYAHESATMSDAYWVRDVYRPNEPQLTWRAAVTGMLIGAVMALSNVYVVLMTGWSLGVTLTSSVMAFAAFELMQFVRLTKRPLGILENNAVATVASAAGFMTGGGNMAAVPALLLVTGTTLSSSSMAIWFSVIAALGVVAAIPLKRLLINVEQLPFPSSIATAQMLRSIHEAGTGTKQARTLAVAAALSAVLAILRGTKVRMLQWIAIPGKWALPLQIAGHPASAWSFGLESSLLLLGSGTLMGSRTAWSLMLGSILGFGWIGPWLVAGGAVSTVSFATLVQATLWPGAAMLVSSGIVALVFQLKAIGQWMSSKVLSTTGPHQRTRDPLAAIECPSSWFYVGVALLSPVAVWMMHRLFAIPVWASMIAIPLALVMGMVAARVTGETDITPTKALGPATQLIYGGLLPGHVAANIMSANVTGGIGLHAADLLSDLKTGYLLGANPRKQFQAQMLGILAGAIAVVPAFRLLVPDAAVLGTDALPAPAVLVWAAVSRAVTSGFGALPHQIAPMVLVAAAVGMVLTLLDRLLPQKIRQFVPSATGLGIALVLPASMSATMALGSLIGRMARRRGAQADVRIIPAASGAIAGESLMGVVLALLTAMGIWGR
jgi:uncharacterized oligopeptide transporter (OPT) family protein